MFKHIGFVTAFVAISLVSYAQKEPFTTYDLFKFKQATETAFSPNGNYLAYVVNVSRPFTDEPGNSYKELYVLDIKNGEIKKYIDGKKSFNHVQWTPDSKRIAFLAKFYDAKKTQVFAISVNGDSAIQITNSPTSIESYDWNPDNSSIAYVSMVEDTSRNKLIESGFNAEIYEEGIAHKTLYLFVISKKSIEQLSQDMSIHNFAWDPKGKKLAVQASKKNLIDDFYMFKKIYTIDAKTRETTILVNNPGKLGGMAWSPNGKNIAFIAGVDINDPVDGSLFVTPVPGKADFKELINFSKDFKGSVTHVEWKDNTTLLYSADESVDCSLNSQTLDSDKPTALLAGGKLAFRNFSYHSGNIAFAANSRTIPGELYTFNIEKEALAVRTELNPWMVNKLLAKQEKISYPARDGLQVEGVLMYPLNYKKGQKYPLINYIHGGPEACVKDGWSTYYSMWGQVAAAKGYFIFMPNYRGSSGRGVAYSKMDQGDMADEEFNDVLDGIDYLIEKGMVDKDKVGIGGGSYGGYFSAWAATKHSDRFAAAVVFVGISNQISKRFTTDIPYESYYSHWTFWTHENYELVYDRSPVKYATNNKTPTLILHGKEDPRVHPSQSLELYRSLKLHGKAPVRLVWYPGEGHGNKKNPARHDYNLRTLEWFDYYLKSDRPKDQMPNKDLEYGVELD